MTDAHGVNWLELVANWSWTVVVGLAVLLGRAYMRVARHDHELETLKEQHAERGRKLSEIDRKIDTNQQIVMAEIGKFREETHRYNQLVLSKLINKVPDA